MITKTIGKVNVNLIDCDFEENKEPFKADLLSIVRDRAVYEYPSIIEEKATLLKKKGYDYLYHLSDIRGNIVRWLPIKKGDVILETEAECGAITGAFLEKTENVTCITRCATDAEILAERFSNCKKLSVYSGKLSDAFQALESEKALFDWIIVTDARALSGIHNLLKKNGRAACITDNRCSMRSFSGIVPDKDTKPFEGVEGKFEAGFTFGGLKKLMKVTGFNEAQMYYPYPDYRFMKMLFSNKRLPRVGELLDNDNNLSEDGYKLFNQKDAFDASCEDGSFQYYSNSYLLVMGPSLEIEYARFSNDRSPEYAIYTTIEDNGLRKCVKKYPLSEVSIEHIKNLSLYEKKLNERYKGSGLNINKCFINEGIDSVFAEFDYAEGTELSKLMDKCLQKKDLKGFYSLFDKYVSLVGYNDDFDFSDIDVVFSNILVNKDEWTLIDYEWCKESSTKIRESAYRSIYCYLLEDKSRKVFDVDEILKKLVLSKEAAEEIELDELSFQKHVTGKRLSLSEIRERLGVKLINPFNPEENSTLDKEIYEVKAYPSDADEKFSEETAFVIKGAYDSETHAKALVPVAAGTGIMRIDPINAPSIVTIKEAKLEELDFPVDSKKYLLSNGKRIGKNIFVFDTSDPNFYFNVDGFVHEEDTFLYVEFEVTRLDAEVAKAVTSNIKKFF